MTDYSPLDNFMFMEGMEASEYYGQKGRNHFLDCYYNRTNEKEDKDIRMMKATQLEEQEDMCTNMKTYVNSCFRIDSKKIKGISKKYRISMDNRLVENLYDSIDKAQKKFLKGVMKSPKLPSEIDIIRGELNSAKKALPALKSIFANKKFLEGEGFAPEPAPVTLWMPQTPINKPSGFQKKKKDSSFETNFVPEEIVIPEFEPTAISF